MSRNGAPREPADVCMVLEGTYPYVFGGVSSWVHDLLLVQRGLRFHLVCLMPARHDGERRFDVPDNVVGITDIALQELPEGSLPPRRRDAGRLFEQLESAIIRLPSGGGLDEMRQVARALQECPAPPGRRLLLDSRPAWDMLLAIYRRNHPTSSFIDFFWSFRAMLSGLYSTLLPELPAARVYHTVSTGYAGLLAARGLVERGRPVLLTEHGIYTNERRIELSMSDWLYERPSDTLDVSASRRELKDLWVETFTAYSRVCYQAASRIVTLYRANQQFQIEDGADPGKLRIIPNGIDYDVYSRVARVETGRPTVALIGRVVPIKDVKTYIRACALLRESVPDVRAWVLGPTDEDEDYYEECASMVRHLALEDVVEFKGRVKLTDYLGEVHAIALTSISEAQPLVILEAGAAAVPTVATDVGACREMILGREDESPKLGPGGAVTPLASPAATAKELARLLNDSTWRHRCGESIRSRVARDYNKTELDASYRELYESYMAMDDLRRPRSEAG